MLRPIDAYTLNNALVSWYNDTEDETEKSILRCVMQMVVHAPTPHLAERGADDGAVAGNERQARLSESI